jgi:hypothetical protein
MLKPICLRTAIILVCAAVSGVAAQEAPKSGSKPTLPAKYEATAFDQTAALGSKSKSFGLTIYVNGLSSEAEIRELRGVLKDKGQDGLVNALQKMKDQGRLSSTGDTGYGMRLATMLPKTDGGYHIVLVTDTPINFLEGASSKRSRDYPLGIVVLDVDKNGKGSGVFAPACSLKINEKDELEMERYGDKPYRLENVRLQQ